MTPADIIAHKRDGQTLTDAEIRFFVDGFSDGTVADYQASAFAMAVWFQGMSRTETVSLTRAMLESGSVMARVTDRPRVDKHSTGGLGDKVSLVLAPLLASAGADVPMISGRGLGHTGGTLDKLESIPGFRCEFAPEQREKILKEVGAFIVSADESIAPADKKLYALRDVTSTVDSIPLITASILSKKLAESLDALVMDVKVGSGAFMQTVDDAESLAESLQEVGSQAGLPTAVMLTEMDQPLGRAVGNAIEVNESLEIMDGRGPTDVRELVVESAATLMVQVGLADDHDAARRASIQMIDGGQTRERFDQMVRAQGGELPSEDRGRLPLAKSHTVLASSSGFIASVDCRALGRLVTRIGGGRIRACDPIDPAVGLMLHHRIGDFVERDTPLVTVHAHDPFTFDYSGDVESAFTIGDGAVPMLDVIRRRHPFR